MLNTDWSFYEEARTTVQYAPYIGTFKYATGRVCSNKDDSGCLKVRVRVNSEVRYLTASKLAWYIIHGFVPKQNVKHRDGDCSNLRILNLYL